MRRVTNSVSDWSEQAMQTKEEKIETPLFGSIGRAAEEVANIADEDETQRPVEEVESMCVRCGKNVKKSRYDS